MIVYTVNIVPVAADAINIYEVNSRTKDIRAVLRSRRGEPGSFFSFTAVADRPAVPALDRIDGCACTLRLVCVVTALCEERAASGSSSTSAARGRGALPSDGLERWMGGDVFLLNRYITADKSASASATGDKSIGLPGMMKAREIARVRPAILDQ